MEKISNTNLDKTKEIFLKSIEKLNENEQKTLLKLYGEVLKDLKS